MRLFTRHTETRLAGGVLVATIALVSIDANAVPPLPPGPIVACELTLHLADTTTLGSLQLAVDYSATGGSIYGANAFSCTGLVPGILSSFHEDDTTSVLTAGFTGIAGIVGPVDLARCTLDLDHIPDAADLSVAEIDAPPITLTGNSTNVCGAPQTGQSPPFVRDAQVVLEAAVGHTTSCQLCECDVNASSSITSADSLAVLRASVGNAAVSCDVACGGSPVTSGPSENVTVTGDLDCYYPCPPEPDPGCATSARSSFRFHDDEYDGHDVIKWKFTGGPAIDQSDFGAPDGVDTTYWFCIYDSTSNVDSLVGQFEIGPHSNWTSKDPHGFLYIDSTHSQSGVEKISLKTGVAGKSKILFMAEGFLAPVPSPYSATEIFDQDPRVTVQLHHDSSADCWQSVYSGRSTNSAEKFSANTP